MMNYIRNQMGKPKKITTDSIWMAVKFKDWENGDL